MSKSKPPVIGQRTLSSFFSVVVPKRTAALDNLEKDQKPKVNPLTIAKRKHEVIDSDGESDRDDIVGNRKTCDDNDDILVDSDDEESHKAQNRKVLKSCRSKFSLDIKESNTNSDETSTSKLLNTKVNQQRPLNNKNKNSVGNRNSVGNKNSSSTTNNTSTDVPIMTKIPLGDGIFDSGGHDHDKLPFLHTNKKRDMNGNSIDHPDYNFRTLQVPQSYLNAQTPAMKQWWQFKIHNMDTVLFFKVGKFYELFHMDADIGMQELDLIYMKGAKAHSGFPEISYGKFSSLLVAKGYKVARIEQTETPEMLNERNKNKGKNGGKEKVVSREICSIMSKGTRTFGTLDDVGMLSEIVNINKGNSSSVLLCIIEMDMREKDNFINESTTSSISVDQNKECKQASVFYAMTCVDTMLGKVSFGYFTDDGQRTYLRTFLSLCAPTEILIERNGISLETKGVIKLLDHQASIEEFTNQDGVHSTSIGLKELLIGKGYFCSNDSNDKARDAIDNCNVQKSSSLSNKESITEIPNMILSLLNGKLISHECLNNALVKSFGGIIWKLNRSLIDYEVLSNAIYSNFYCKGVNGTLTLPFQVDDNVSNSYSSDSVLHNMKDPLMQNQYLSLDSVTLKNLEVFQNNADGSDKGSLWGFLNRCSTQFGARLLKEWLKRPLMDVTEIRQRREAIEELINDLSPEVDASKKIMKSMPDMERLLLRIYTNSLKKKGDDHPDCRAILYEADHYNARKIKEFADLLRGLEMTTEIFDLFINLEIKSEILHSVFASNGNGNDVDVLIDGAAPYEKGDQPNRQRSHSLIQCSDIKGLLLHYRNIFDEKQAKRDGFVKPKKGVNEQYDEAKQVVMGIEEELEAYLKQQKQDTGISDIKYFSTNKDRYQLEIPIRESSLVPQSWASKSQKKTHRRYWTTFIQNKLKALNAAEKHLVEAQNDTMRLMFEHFDKRKHIWNYLIKCISSLDALISLALVSSSPDYTWPEIRDRQSNKEAPYLIIEKGRHPMLEYAFSFVNNRSFIPNSVSLGSQPIVSEDNMCSNSDFCPDRNSRLLLLTGPNMGGKSTLLRQSCLLVIMAQMGMKVPADLMLMSVVDKIFTRIGASDSILSAQSTFFVELAETAYIMQESTENSLCILDELGRGTATFDGTAIAHSVLKFLMEKKGCRAMFATHYHSLVKDWSKDTRINLGHMECVVANDGNENTDESFATGSDQVYNTE
jgi:DNA mismatch repair protein MSH6